MKSETTLFYRYFPISRHDKNWGLYITTAGESRADPHTTYPSGGPPKGYTFDWQHGRILNGFALLYISNCQNQRRGRSADHLIIDFQPLHLPKNPYLLPFRPLLEKAQSATLLHKSRIDFI